MEKRLLFEYTEELTKTSPGTGTCYTKGSDTVLDGIYSQFRDTFFFTYIIQFVLVFLMYKTAGSGRYWRVLNYASIAGLLASCCENIVIAFICSESNKLKNGKVYPFLIGEIFWIITEYSIPYLNLIKMKAIAKGRIATVIKWLIYLLLVPFAISRILIGYCRMQRGYLNDEEIELFHGIAFGIMAVADLLCTIFILYFIRSYSNRSSTHGNDLTNHIQQSSYTILIAVDVVSLLLSILYIAVTFIYRHPTLKDNKILTNILTRNCVLPFHCFKSVFLLILATDALLFKYGASNNTSLRDSSGNVTRDVTEGSYRTVTNNMSSRVSNFRPPETPNISSHTPNNPALRSPKVMSMSAFGYNPSNDIYSQSPSPNEGNPQKVGYMNYNNININNTSSSNTNNSNNDIDIRPYPSDQFGFLHHGEYSELIFKDNYNMLK